MNSTAGEAGVTLLDADQVSRTVARIAHQIIEKTALDGEDSRRVVLLGIPSGGVPLAARLAEKIQHFTGVEVFQGSLDITLYRDDLRNTTHRALKPTKVPAEGIDDAIVVLVDDVLYSGRSIRAALDALTDIGRPYAVQVAVLIDRGHRKLPIRANYVGKNIPTAADEGVTVNLAELDGVDNVVLTRRPGTGEGSN